VPGVREEWDIAWPIHPLQAGVDDCGHFLVGVSRHDMNIVVLGCACSQHEWFIPALGMSLAKVCEVMAKSDQCCALVLAERGEVH